MKSKFDVMLQFFKEHFPNNVLHDDLQITLKCPFCVDYHKQKLKLSFNTQKQIFHCWVCQTGGIGFYNFLKKLRDNNNITNYIFNEYLTQYNNAKNIKPNIPPHQKQDQNIWQYKYKNILQLSDTFNKKIMISYIKKRGFNQLDIIKYNISVIQDNLRYSNRIILPSYNDKFQLNYFIARSYMSNINPKYMNSKIDKKNLIFFQYLINWKLPLILTQGVFDAMTIDCQSIPLLGKNVSTRLKQRILEQKVKQVYIALDGDAYRDAIKLAYTLVSLNVKYIHIIKFKQDQDCNSLGRQTANKLIQQSKPLDIQQILRLYKGGK